VNKCCVCNGDTKVNGVDGITIDDKSVCIECYSDARMLATAIAELRAEAAEILDDIAVVDQAQNRVTDAAKKYVVKAVQRALKATKAELRKEVFREIYPGLR